VKKSGTDSRACVPAIVVAGAWRTALKSVPDFFTNPDAVNSVSLAFRRFRPPQTAHVITEQRPVHITSPAARGAVEIAKGPWFTSGNWWRTDMWNREEWDIALRSGALYRIFRDLRTETWFVEGNYD
jgi:hypothetical protein